MKKMKLRQEKNKKGRKTDNNKRSKINRTTIYNFQNEFKLKKDS